MTYSSLEKLPISAPCLRIWTFVDDADSKTCKAIWNHSSILIISKLESITEGEDWKELEQRSFLYANFHSILSDQMLEDILAAI